MKRHMQRHGVAQPQDQSIKLIPLTQGKNAIVDAEDYERLNQWNWSAMWRKRGERFYAVRGIRLNGVSRLIYMHREVLQDYASKEIDHKNCDSLDYRKSNLRPCTRFNNAANRSKYKNNRSGYKGVSWSIVHKKWIAQICVMGCRKHLGYFATAKEAHTAYSHVAISELKEFARTS